MKNILIICLCLMLLLSACGGSAEPTTPTAAPTEATQAPEVTDAPTDPTENEAVDLKELAKSCIGKFVEELYELIGEPESSDYATSCLGEGEDGNLYYDGFTVYTYREGDEETVRVVD